MKRIFASALAIFVFLGDGIFAYSAETNFWSARRPAPLLSPLPALIPRNAETPRLPDLNQADLKDKDLVVHIQDVHMNFEAQQSIARIISRLVENDGFRLVGLEGAFGKIDLTPFKAVDNGIREATADHFLSQLQIGGPVHYALTHPERDIKMVGVEDRALFRNNWASVLDVRATAAALRKILDARYARLLADKKRVFNPRLMEFDVFAEAYREGGSPKDYVELLRRHGGPAGPNMALFQRASDIERQFEAAKQGRVKPGSLREAIADYLSLSERISAEALLAEIDESERSVYAKLAITEPERALLDKAGHLRLSRKLVNFSLTPQQWAIHKNSSASNEIGRFKTVFENFYEIAKRRDDAIARNLAAALRTHRQRRAILVTGGFHSKGIKKALEARGVSVVTVAPQFNLTDVASGSDALMKIAEKRDVLSDLFVKGNTFLSQPAMTRTLYEAVAHDALNRTVRSPDPKISSAVRPVAAALLAPLSEKIVFGIRVLGRSFMLLVSPIRLLFVGGGKADSDLAKAQFLWNESSIWFEPAARYISENYGTGRDSRELVVVLEEWLLHHSHLTLGQWLTRLHNLSVHHATALIGLRLALWLTGRVVRLWSIVRPGQDILKAKTRLHILYNRYVGFPLGIAGFSSNVERLIQQKMPHVLEMNKLLQGENPDRAQLERLELKIFLPWGPDEDPTTLKNQITMFAIQKLGFFLDPNFLIFRPRFPYGGWNISIYFDTEFFDYAMYRESNQNNDFRMQLRGRTHGRYPTKVSFQIKYLLPNDAREKIFFEVRIEEAWKVVLGIWDPSILFLPPTHPNYRRHYDAYREWVKILAQQKERGRPLSPRIVTSYAREALEPIMVMPGETPPVRLSWDNHILGGILLERHRQHLANWAPMGRPWIDVDDLFQTVLSATYDGVHIPNNPGQLLEIKPAIEGGIIPNIVHAVIQKFDLGQYQRGVSKTADAVVQKATADPAFARRHQIPLHGAPFFGPTRFSDYKYRNYPAANLPPEKPGDTPFIETVKWDTSNRRNTLGLAGSSSLGKGPASMPLRPGASNSPYLFMRLFFNPPAWMEKGLFAIGLAVEILVVRQLIGGNSMGLIVFLFMATHMTVRVLLLLRGKILARSLVPDLLWDFFVIGLYATAVSAALVLGFPVETFFWAAAAGHVGIDLLRNPSLLKNDERSLSVRPVLLFLLAMVGVLIIPSVVQAAAGAASNALPLFANGADGGLAEFFNTLLTVNPNARLTPEKAVVTGIMTVVNSIFVILAHRVTYKLGRFEPAYPLCLTLGSLGVSGMIIGLQGALMYGLIVIGVLSIFRNRYGERFRKDFTFLSVSYVLAYWVANGFPFYALGWNIGLVLGVSILFRLAGWAGGGEKQFELHLVYVDTLLAEERINAILAAQAEPGFIDPRVISKPGMGDDAGVLIAVRTITLDLKDPSLSGITRRELLSIPGMRLVDLVDTTADIPVTGILFPLSFGSLLAASGSLQAAEPGGTLFAQGATFNTVTLALGVAAAILTVLVLVLIARKKSSIENFSPELALGGDGAEWKPTVIKRPLWKRVGKNLRWLVLPMFVVTGIAVSLWLKGDMSTKTTSNYPGFAEPAEPATPIVALYNGVITEVYVSKTQRHVKKGQKLFGFAPEGGIANLKLQRDALIAATRVQLEKANIEIGALRERVKVESADYQQKIMNLHQLEVSKDRLEIQLRADSALLKYAKGYETMTSATLKQGAGSQLEVDRARAEVDRLSALVDTARSSIASLEKEIGQSRSELAKFKPSRDINADLKPYMAMKEALMAEMDAKLALLEPTVIVAPFDGYLEGPLPSADTRVVAGKTLAMLTSEEYPTIGWGFADPKLGKLLKAGDKIIVQEDAPGSQEFEVEVRAVFSNMSNLDDIMRAYKLEVSDIPGANRRRPSLEMMRMNQGVPFIFVIPKELKITGGSALRIKHVQEDRPTTAGRLAQWVGLEKPKPAEPKPADAGQKVNAPIGTYQGLQAFMAASGRKDLGNNEKEMSGGWRQGNLLYFGDDETDRITFFNLDELAKDVEPSGFISIKGLSPTIGARFDFEGAAPHPDGKRVLLLSETHRELHLVDLSGHKDPKRDVVFKFPADFAKAEAIAYSKDGRLFIGHGGHDPKLSEFVLNEAKRTVENKGTIELKPKGVGDIRDAALIDLGNGLDPVIGLLDSKQQKIHFLEVGRELSLAIDAVDLGNFPLGEKKETLIDLGGGRVLVGGELKKTAAGTANWAAVEFKKPEPKGAKVGGNMVNLPMLLILGLALSVGWYAGLSLEWHALLAVALVSAPFDFFGALRRSNTIVLFAVRDEKDADLLRKLRRFVNEDQIVVAYLGAEQEVPASMKDAAGDAWVFNGPGIDPVANVYKVDDIFSLCDVSLIDASGRENLRNSIAALADPKSTQGSFIFVSSDDGRFVVESDLLRARQLSSSWVFDALRVPTLYQQLLSVKQALTHA